MTHLAMINKTLYNNMAISFIILITALLFSCSENNSKNKDEAVFSESSLLLEYLEENGNIINSSDIPSLINANEVFSNIKGSNYLIIDLRPHEVFEEGHIQTSVNVQPNDILHYFENIIEPNSFEKIILVCPNAYLSNHVNAILRFLGYNNVFSLRYGLSSWNKSIAENYWLASMSSFLEGKLETTDNKKLPESNLPILKTGEMSPYKVLRARAEIVLDTGLEEVTISVKDLMESSEDFYIISYWPMDMHQKGHLPNAVQYNPKKSLHSSEDILSLPLDKKIAVYCFTGHHSAYVTAFLRILGYDVYNVEYGANSFIHNTIVNTQRKTRWFKESHIHNYPLVSDEQENIINEIETPDTEKITIQGGC